MGRGLAESQEGGVWGGAGEDWGGGGGGGFQRGRQGGFTAWGAFPAQSRGPAGMGQRQWRKKKKVEPDGLEVTIRFI